VLVCLTIDVALLAFGLCADVVDQAPIRQLPLLQGVWEHEEGKRPTR